MTRLFLAFQLIASLVVVGLPSYAAAQADPRQMLGGLIQQLSTGQPNPSWYGPQLWQTIAMQTGNTGVYPQLVQAGPATNISLINQQQLPQGSLFRMRSQHASGTSFIWLIGYNSFTNRIEYMNSSLDTSFVPGGGGIPAGGGGIPGTGGTTTIPGGGSGGGGTGSGGGTTSSACQRFPELCG